VAPINNPENRLSKHAEPLPERAEPLVTANHFALIRAFLIVSALSRAFSIRPVEKNFVHVKNCRRATPR